MRLTAPFRGEAVNAGHRILRVLFWVVLVTTLLIAVWILVNRARGSEALARSRIVEQTAAASGKLRLQFGQILTQLGAIRTLGVLGVLDSSEEEAFVPALAALLEPVIGAAAVIVDVPGRRFLLSRQADGESSAAWSITPEETGLAAPWLEELPEAAGDGQIRWLDTRTGLPYGFRGLAAWLAWEGAGAQDSLHAVAVVIGEAQLEELVRTLELGMSGEVVLLSNPERVVHFSPTIPGYEELATREQFIAELDAAGTSPLAETVLALGPGSEVPPARRFALHGRPGWYAFQPMRFGERVFWLGLVVPESELLPPLRRGESRLLFVLLGVLAMAVSGVFLLARLYGSRLRQLADRPKYRTATEEQLLSLIAQGENERLEFKTTMRWNLKENKPGVEISRAWLKTLAAFLNTGGGTLLMGVGDNGEITGIEADRFSSEDKALLHFNNLIKEHIGLEHAGPISVAPRTVRGRTILVVDCEPARRPVFLKFGDEEEYFVRVASGTRRLPLSKVLEHMKQRYGS